MLTNVPGRIISASAATTTRATKKSGISFDTHQG
jgi:hypothetical protein